jgi:hypothetical protein
MSKKDENGEIVVAPEGTRFDIENEELFTEELQKLINVTIDIPIEPIPVGDFKNVDLLLQTIDFLMNYEIIVE